MRYVSTSALPFAGHATAPVTAAGASGVTSRCCAFEMVSFGSISGTAATSPPGFGSGVTTTAAPSGFGRRERGQAGIESSATNGISVFAPALTYLVASRGWIEAIISASATRTSPTLASPFSFQIALPLRSGTTSSVRTSPGTTGLRNRALSIAMK